ncbi:MAG: hypothetical protein R3A46_01280 [Thermomicrobiales bacterium]
MRRLILDFGLVYLPVALLVVIDDRDRPEEFACGDPPPTATNGPPTPTQIPHGVAT